MSSISSLSLLPPELSSEVQYQLLFREATQHCIENHYDNALEILDIVIAEGQSRRHYIGALTLKGTILEKRFQKEEALECFETVLRIEERNIEALRGKGNLLFRSKPITAERCFESILRINHADPQALYKKGELLYLRDELDLALTSFDFLLNDVVDHHNVYSRVSALNYKASILRKKEKYEAALQTTTEALICDPTYSYAWINRGNILRNLGMHEEASRISDISIRVLDASSEYIASIMQEHIGVVRVVVSFG